MRAVPYPFAERSFQRGYGGRQGPKGRNRNLPRPPGKKSYRDAYLLFALLPQEIRITANFQLPLRGSLLVRYLNSYVKPPSLREVDFAKQKTEGVHRGCSLFISTPQSHFVRQLPGRGAFWAYNLLLSRPWQQLSRSFAKVAQHKHERSGDEQPQRGKAC